MLASITFCSDLHVDLNPGLEKEFIQAYKDFPGILVIAGDFCNGVDNPIFYDTFQELFALNSKIQVIFVPGNHDYYGKSLDWVDTYLNTINLGVRFYFLNTPNSVMMCGSVIFQGSTLWYPDTPDTWLLQNNINDFSQIHSFKPDDAHRLNKNFKSHLEQTLYDPRAIWITHHLPSNQSVHSKYRGGRLNCYFVDSTFEKLILEKQPKFVIHGHSHHNNCYQIGDTWVLSNPYGYGRENPEFNWFKHIIWL